VAQVDKQPRFCGRFSWAATCDASTGINPL